MLVTYVYVWTCKKTRKCKIRNMRIKGYLDTSLIEEKIGETQ